MPNYDEVKRMMSQAQTPAEKNDAVRALSEHIPANMKDKSMVTLSRGSDKNTLKLGDLHLHSQNDEVYQRLKDVVTGE